MQYEEPNKEEIEDIDPGDDLKSLENISIDEVTGSYEEEDYEVIDAENAGSKGEGPQSDHESLKARRALEEHLENKRLRKELDYLYDENFIEGDEEESGSSNMTSYDFQTKAHAKWILAGEHAVLRNSSALVFPVPNKYLQLSYIAAENELSADFSAPYGETLLLFFWGVLEQGLHHLGLKQEQLKGKFFLENNIPMGSGMGFSAALCVAVARWFAFQKWISMDELFDFARKLENSFHGKSSGVDIAGVLNNQGIRFKSDTTIQPIPLAWQPKLYLSCSESISVTAQCIKAVDELWKKHPQEAQKIDAEMAASVELAEKALMLNQQEGFPLLAEAISSAHRCFEKWGLIKGALEQHIQTLREKGAVAIKPTGAGSGGYVLSLWNSEPPDDLPFDLDPCIE